MEGRKITKSLKRCEWISFIKSFGIVGETGYIGAALCLELCRRQKRVHRLGMSWRAMEYRSAVLNLVRAADCVYFLAGGRGQEIPEDLLQSIITQCQKSDTQLVYLSSSVVYQPKYADKFGIVENNLGSYADRKMREEQLILSACSHLGLEGKVVRLFNCFGGAQTQGYLVPDVLAQAVESDVIQLRTSDPSRDYLHLQDVVDALIYAGDMFSQLPGVVDLGSGQVFRVTEIVDMLGRAMKRNLEASFERTGDNSCFQTNQDLMLQNFGWDCTDNIESRLAMVVEDKYA